MPDAPPRSTNSSAGVAAALVSARLSGRALAGFPGALPADLPAAYRCQDEAIALWPAPVVGWKVGYIAAARRGTDADDRLVGPVFADRLQHDSEAGPVFAVIDGGFAAVEAEYVFRLGQDADPARLDWSPGDAAALVAALHIGVELAGSPLAAINEIGPLAVVSDCGNNAGLVLGAPIADWRSVLEQDLLCSCWIDGELVGRGGAPNLPGGPLAALAFALARNALRGRPLRAGDLVTTGAATGIHDIRAGQRAVVDFGRHGRIRCHAVAAAAKD